LFAQAFSARDFSHQCILAKHGCKTFQLVPYFFQRFEVMILDGVGNDRFVSEQRGIQRAQKLVSTAGISQKPDGFFHGQKTK